MSNDTVSGDDVAPKSILDVLPGEIIGTEIISLCTARAQFDLCLVSKLFKELAYPQLYQTVRLNKPAKIISFDRVISDNPGYAVWVREIFISTYYPGDVTATNHFLPRLTELHNLSLLWNSDKLINFRRLRFPRLCVLRLKGHLDLRPWYAAHEHKVISDFLNRHPTLLHVNDGIQGRTYLEASLVELPNLLVYRGLHSRPPGILKNANKLTSVWFNSVDLDVLARFPACQDVVIEILQGLDIPDMFKRLKQYLPNLKSCLLIICVSTVLTPSILSEALSGFKQLESFGVLREDSYNIESMIQSCSESCPNLQECIFASENCHFVFFLFADFCHGITVDLLWAIQGCGWKSSAYGWALSHRNCVSCRLILSES
ncbi:hypothetical protein C8J56DRAFT_977171 [Mycena floridula]|nr:hypothetical protein C8J56DRAFT_977171 [Mycena floridula]